MDMGCSSQSGKSSVSLGRKMSKVGLLAAMKTFTKPHFQRRKKSREKSCERAVSRSWDSGLAGLGLPATSSHHQLGTAGSYKKIHWTGDSEYSAVCGGKGGVLNTAKALKWAEFFVLSSVPGLVAAW